MRLRQLQFTSTVVMKYRGFSVLVIQEGRSTKCYKYDIKFISIDLEARFKKLELGNSQIIFDRPLAVKTYYQCEVVKFFIQLGFESFIKDLPRDYYPNCVYEF